MLKNRLFFIVFISALFVLPKNYAQQKYDVAAYVWPAYHDEPRWREIGLFYDGRGEWETLYKTKPKYDGHRQPRVPLCGYQDEADPEVQEQVIETATAYGVNTFIFDWYWYDNRPFLEGALNAFLKAKNTKKMKFYLMWANHTANTYWDYNEHDKSRVYWRGDAVTPEIFDGFTDHIINDYFLQPNYYKIDGKPVFAIYEIGTFIKGMGGIEQAKTALDKFRKKCVKAGLKGVHLQAILWNALPETLSGVPGETAPTQDNTIKQLGFNSLTNYQWCHYVPANQDYQSWGEKATAKYSEFGSNFSVPYFPHVSIDWDNNPRFPTDNLQPAVTGVTPQKFFKFLVKAKDYADAHPKQTPLITINAWNEWSEGSYLEPDTYYQYDFLEAVKSVFVDGKTQPMMMYGDTTRTGTPYAKDPHVVNFKGRYLMYYSIPPHKDDKNGGWNIGIAESRNLTDWTKVGEITPAEGCDYEKKGLCAPGALVRDGKVYLFYQTYGNARNDAICNAVSDDGINFKRNPTNPIYHPQPSDWTCGRAIDAEVCFYNNKYYLFYATRDTAYKIQKIGVATAPAGTNFNREDWTPAADNSVLFPELPWEKSCIEGPSITVQNGKMYMFYAGAYNNEPQQIGVAVSTDGVQWTRLSDKPFLTNGQRGDWNESESGHPHIFTDNDGRTYLFYQGNRTKGKDWFLSQKPVFWKDGVPRF